MNGTIHEAFIAHIFSDFQKYCSMRAMRPNTATFLDFLVTRNLIVQKEIHHYSIIQEYQAWTALQKYRNKTETIRALAHTYGLHESTVWNVLKDHGGKFKDPPQHTPGTSNSPD